MACERRPTLPRKKDSQVAALATMGRSFSTRRARMPFAANCRLHGPCGRRAGRNTPAIADSPCDRRVARVQEWRESRGQLLLQSAPLCYAINHSIDWKVKRSRVALARPRISRRLRSSERESHSVRLALASHSLRQGSMPTRRAFRFSLLPRQCTGTVIAALSAEACLRAGSGARMTVAPPWMRRHDPPRSSLSDVRLVRTLDAHERGNLCADILQRVGSALACVGTREREFGPPSYDRTQRLARPGMLPPLSSHAAANPVLQNRFRNNAGV